METKREKSSSALHPSESSLKFDLGEGERMTGMKGTVHIRVCHCCEELWMSFSEFIRIRGGILLLGGGIGLKDGIVAPVFLIFFFYGNKGITLLSLLRIR